MGTLVPIAIRRDGLTQRLSAPSITLILKTQITEKQMTKVKHRTNIQFITDLMSHSQQGALMQAYLIEAIHAYSKQTKVAPPWSTDNTFISEAAWRACADEALDAINNRNK
jgi:hypothetical protein